MPAPHPRDVRALAARARARVADAKAGRVDPRAAPSVLAAAEALLLETGRRYPTCSADQPPAPFPTHSHP